ncbi:MAG TPA: amino acid-binding protein [Methanomicrobiales archaeon]|nr:amino acid-binding protein [Methanomicrobiales archaeon]
MKLEMKDTPGQLVRVLEPISACGGNIIAVIHQRDPESESDTLDVQIVLDLPAGRLPSLVDQIKSLGVDILRIGEERLIHRRSLIMIGHIMHTDISDTVDQIDRTGFAEVAELSLMMPAISERSSARITIKTANRADMETAVGILREVAAKKDILVVEPLEDGA